MDAIGECKRAIELDPDFGNPYNDIGAYLIELGQFDEAIPWLQQAVEARRYEPRHFPHYNMGRAYLGKEMYGKAMRCFQEAISVEPRYTLARQALESLRRMVNWSQSSVFSSQSNSTLHVASSTCSGRSLHRYSWVFFLTSLQA